VPRFGLDRPKKEIKHIFVVYEHDQTWKELFVLLALERAILHRWIQAFDFYVRQYTMLNDETLYKKLNLEFELDYPDSFSERFLNMER
jgi:hypothetical protein